MDSEAPVQVGIGIRPIPNKGPFPDPVIPKATHFVCYHCGEVFPREEFAHIAPTSQGRNRCLICDKAEVVARAAMLKKDETLAKFALITSKAKRMDERDLPTIGELCAGMVSKFGGTEAFLDMWYEQINANFISKPGSKIGLDHMHAIAKMAAESQKIGIAERAADRLTDEERLEEMKMLAKRVQLFEAPEDEPPRITEEKKVG